jgi:FMN phosphatase YigB (HAD superfamily)
MPSITTCFYGKKQMKPILLFDLDNTLLFNDINTFLGGYLKALGKHLSYKIAPERMIRELMAGTDQMIQKRMPAGTLEETFDSHFYPGIGIPKSELIGSIHRFYGDIFPSLQPLTRLRPEAVQLIETAFAEEFPVVVATNPLFPRRAILHRLEWAGVPTNKFPFSLVTSYESFHFAKPNPAYYAEILAQLGFPDRPALMIGNSFEDDILPASILGIPGFFLTDEKVQFPQGLHPLTRQGTFDEILPWIHAVDLAQIELIPSVPAGIMALLKSTPAAIQSLSQNLVPTQWTNQPVPGEWNLAEILAHIDDADREVYLPRLHDEIHHPDSFMFDNQPSPKENERVTDPANGLELIQSFMNQRMRMIELLDSLSESEWLKPIQHPFLEPTNMIELVKKIIKHDRLHVQQFHKTIKEVV